MKTIWKISRTSQLYWYLMCAPFSFDRRNVLGKPGWVMSVRQPNGGHASFPARTRLGCWRKLIHSTRDFRSPVTEPSRVMEFFAR